MSELTVPITTDDHSQGEAGAKCTLVEYGDYQCSYCGQAAPVVKRLQDHFGADLRFVFRNFPLREMHPNAVHAAEAAEFAAASGKFWEMHDLLYQNQASLEDNALLAFADRLHLASDKLGEVLRLETYQPRIKSDFSGGVHSGVNGTPTFFLNGRRHDGGFDYETLSNAVRQYIESGPGAKRQNGSGDNEVRDYDSRLRHDARFPDSAGEDAGAGTQNDQLSPSGDEPPVT